MPCFANFPFRWNRLPNLRNETNPEELNLRASVTFDPPLKRKLREGVQINAITNRCELVVKLFLLRFFEVQKTEQRYRERDNELISIQWQFQVKPNFAPKNMSSQFETLSLPQTHQYRVAQPGSPAGVK